MKQIIFLGVCGVVLTMAGLGILLAHAQTAPDHPENLQAAANSACSVNINWNESRSTPADYFDLKENSASPLKINVSGSGSFSYLRKGLAPDVNYSYALQSCNYIGGSGVCSVLVSTGASGQPVSAKTPKLLVPPAPPTDPRAVSWNSTGDAVTLAWTPTATPSYSGFRVFRSDDNGGSWKVIGTFSSDTFTANGNQVPFTTDPTILHIYKIETYQTGAWCGDGTQDSPVVDNSTTAGMNGIVFSTDSPLLYLPPSPSSISASAVVSGTVTNTTFNWTASSHATNYELQISQDSNFGTGVIDNVYGNQISAGPIAFANQNLDFYYRVRALVKSGTAITSFSYWKTVNQPFHTGYTGPTGFKAIITSLSFENNNADILLTWNDEADYYHKIYIYRQAANETSPTRIKAIDGDHCHGTPPACHYATSYTDTVPMGNTTGGKYDYYVSFFIIDQNKESVPSNHQTVNTKINPVAVTGWGWSAKNDGGTISGPGWIRLTYNSTSTEAWGGTVPVPADGQHYGLIEDTDGNLSGYIAASNYGYLSFNPADMPHCPDSETSAPCGSPQVDKTTGNVRGWARFTAADPAKGAWDGYVSLSTNQIIQEGVNYGLKISSNTGVISGYAWGGNLIGWIAFLKAPIIINVKSVTPIGCSTATNCPIQLTWDNPVTFSRMELWYSKPLSSLNSVDKNADFPLVNFSKINDSSLLQQGSGKTITTDNPDINITLTPNTNYGFFLRAWP